MSSTHRKKIARGLARATGLTYQQALALVAEADDAGRLPRPLDDHGIARAIKMLADEAQPAPVAFEGLPASAEDRDALARTLSDLPAGLVVVAGSVGSGKTTTLYEILTHLAISPKKIISFEDVVERRIVPDPDTHRGLIQQVDRGDDADEFDRQVRAAIRRHPDALALGEVRDSGSAKWLTEAALTGHLVLATVHASTPAHVVDRLTSMGAGRAALADTLAAVVVAKCGPDGQFAVTVHVVDEEVRAAIAAGDNWKAEHTRLVDHAVVTPPAAAYDKRNVVDALNRLAALLRIGGASWASLEAVADSAPNDHVRAMFERVLPVIMGGGSWSDGFAESPEVFEPWAIALIRSGEECNKVPHALEEVARLL